MYKTDKDIAAEFKDFTIKNIKINPSRKSGYIEIDFPHACEHVGGGTDSVCDNFIKYDSGNIAFNNWYPEDVYFALVSSINAEILKLQ